MKTRVETETFRTADDVPFELTIVYFYEEYEVAGKPQRSITAKAGIDGRVPVEGWDTKNDLPEDFHAIHQTQLRDGIRRFIELRESSEINGISEPRIIGHKLILREEDV